MSEEMIALLASVIKNYYIPAGKQVKSESVEQEQMILEVFIKAALDETLKHGDGLKARHAFWVKDMSDE